MIMQASLENLLNNPFINHFVGCVENLPNNLQFLLSELRSVDSQVNAHHRKLNTIKENYCGGGSDVISVDQLACIHNTLLKCQELGDQKVELVGQIIDLLDKKTKQLILDTKTLDERAFKIEIDEDKIVSDFKASIRHHRQNHHHHHHHRDNKDSSKNYSIVTKGMSKYISGAAAGTSTSNEYRSHSSLSTTSNKKAYLSNSSSNNLQSRNSNYQLPDRKAKKPRIDDQQPQTHNISITSSKSTHKTTSENGAYSMTRSSKRQLNYSSTNTITTPNQISNSKKRHHILNHQSSPSSTSSSSSLTNRHLSTRQLLQRATTIKNHSNRDENTNDLNNNNNDDLNDSNDDYNSTTAAAAATTTTTTHRKHAPPPPPTPQHHSNSNSDDDDDDDEDNNDDDDDENSSTVSSTNSNSQQKEVYNNNLTVLGNIGSSNSNVLSSINSNINSISNNNNNNNNEANEPLYCTCRQISYGQMIMCDNSDCDLEWFHFDCVKLTSKPKGKWYCPKCRDGDNHKIMRKPINNNNNISTNTNNNKK